VPLTFDITDHIATITIDNPPLNLFTRDFVEELPEIVDSFGVNSGVRVAILTGSGTRAFTAGADLRRPGYPGPPPAEGRLDLPGSLAGLRRIRNYKEALADSAVPVIGAINGYCLGHGIGLAAACDILLASKNAVFGLPEVNVGAANGYRAFRELFPRGHGRHAYFTGEYIGAEEAYRVGAVYSIHEPDELMDAAYALARTIAAKSPALMRLFKQTVDWTEDMDPHTGYHFESQAFEILRRSPEVAAELVEARQAFQEKRPPKFAG
jgi:enoyl-CoA hydratase